MFSLLGTTLVLALAECTTTVHAELPTCPNGRGQHQMKELDKLLKMILGSTPNSTGTYLIQIEYNYIA